MGLCPQPSPCSIDERAMPEEWHSVAAWLMRATFHPVELLAEAVSSSSTSTASFDPPQPSPVETASIPPQSSQRPLPRLDELPCSRTMDRRDPLSGRSATSSSGLSPHPPTLPLAPGQLVAHRLPTLPDDLLAYIISFCPTPTLASWSLVSFRCLELAGRVLYGKVEIRRHGGYDRLFCERDPTTSLHHLEPHLSLHGLTSLNLLVRPSSPVSPSRLLPFPDPDLAAPLDSSTDPRPVPISLINLTLHLPPTGLTGHPYTHLLSLLRPRNLIVVHPSVQQSTKFWFGVDRKSWDVISGWVREGLVERCVMRGCTVVGGLDRDGRGSNAGGFFLGPPPLTTTTDVPGQQAPFRIPDQSRSRGLSLTYDLTTLPPLTIPFYTNLLLHLQHDGCFNLPLSAPPTQSSETAALPPSPTSTPFEGALLVLVPREKEKTWIERGLVALKEDERQRVRVEVVDVREGGWWNGGAGTSSSLASNGGNGGRGSREGRGGWGW